MEKEEKLLIDLEIRSGIPEVDAYIDSLHEHLLSFEASSIKKMLVAMDTVAQKITEDLLKVADGETEEEGYFQDDGQGHEEYIAGSSKLKVLSDNKNSKVFDRLMTLVSKMKDFKDVSEMAEKLKPEIKKKEAEKQVKENTIELNGKSVFESLQEKVLKKGKNG